MRRLRWALVCTLGVLLAGSAVLSGQIGSRAQTPVQFPYHGLLEKDGVLVQAIGTDKVQFQVSLWDAPELGNKIWPTDADAYEVHAVNVYDGRFAINIGSQVPYAHTVGTAVYLDIQVKGPADDEFVTLGGRQPFLYAPHAVTARRSDGDFDVAGTVTANGLTAGALQAETDVNVGQQDAPADLTVHGDVLADNLWTKVYEGDMPDGTSFTVTGLDGNTARVYRVVFHGWIGGSASDQKILLRPNGIATASYRSFVVFNGDSSDGEWDLTGFYLGRNAFGYGANFLIEFTLSAVGSSFTNHRVGQVHSAFFYTNGKMLDFRGGGALGSDAAITSLQLVTTGTQTMSGHITVFAMDR